MSGLAILCSGQGQQDVTLFERIRAYPEAQALMQRIRQAGVLPEALVAWLAQPKARPELIFQNDIAQPLVCLYQMLVWSLIQNRLPTPAILAGYSLGELAAYGCAGIFTPETLVRLAAVRGCLMTAAATDPQTMLAVIGLKRDRLAAICAGMHAQIAIINGADHFIVGLPLDKLAAFSAQCQAARAAKIVHLPVSVAAHTAAMRRAAEDFRAVLQQTEFQPKPAGILAGINGAKVFTREQVLAALTAQIHQAIDWQACMESAVAYGCRVFLELGPGNRLAHILLEYYPHTEARSISEFHDIHAVSHWVAAAMARQA